MNLISQVSRRTKRKTLNSGRLNTVDMKGKLSLPGGEKKKKREKDREEGEERMGGGKKKGREERREEGRN